MLDGFSRFEIMVIAYIFVVLKSLKGEPIINNPILKDDGVKDAVLVYGVYDLVVKVDFKDMKMLYEFMSKLRKIKDVGKTSTMISIGGA